MASNVNVQLIGAFIQVVDNAASTQRVNSPITALVAQAVAAYYDPYFLVPTGATALTLPAATVWTVVIRNISPTNTIAITLTPAGGSAWVSPYILPPTSLFLIWSNYASNPSSGGFTAASVLASGATTYAEVLLAA